ncbi:uncharacterized protein PRCAT00005097001 [Priceomyces carsonii]|uniref:uncharacterized protein n=1 Tax=Priceomyces carsonii TaxID=28549 RepID=UPI002ED8FA18|nr:unnamed protein product [Priceomyces carsonii]
MVSSLPKTMKAVTFFGAHDIRVIDKPVPVIEETTDAIIKIHSTALCGSELHPYRGAIIPPSTGHTMGHEFTGVIVEVGSDVKNFETGDEVVSIFTTQCGKCFYCTHGVSSKCPQAFVFGTVGHDGGQAEYCRIPLADTTLKLKPKGIDDSIVILMADIFPTGYFGVKNLLEKIPEDQISSSVVVQLGCGPVGLCAIAAAKEKGIRTLYAIESVPERLELAEKFGAIPLNLEKDNIEEIINKATENRGADGVLEVVGSEDALALGFKLVRNGGVISSIGYQHGKIPFSGLDCYLKNVTLQFGRCPCYSLFQEAIESFTKVAHLFKGFVDLNLPLSEAPKAYKLFEKHGARKIVFKPSLSSEKINGSSSLCS